MSEDEPDPVATTDNAIARQRQRLTAIARRVATVEDRRRRLFEEISSVELYLIRRRRGA